MKEKLIKISGKIFALGMGILMIVALVVALLYILAFFIGVSAAEALCAFLGSHILPVVYIAAMALCVLGVLNMYLRKEHVFLLDLSSGKPKDN